MLYLAYLLSKARKDGGGMLTRQQRPVAQGRVCAGDMPTWPSQVPQLDPASISAKGTAGTLSTSPPSSSM